MRPAAIYCALFVWNSTTGGRFIAPYLHIAHHLNNSSYVGSIISFQFFTTSILSSWGGGKADEMERKYPSIGRIYVLIGGISLGSFAFLMESLDNVFIRIFNTLHLLDIIETDGDIIQGGTEEERGDIWLLLFIWHLFWRIIYAVAIALTAPVLDGLTIAHLKREAHSNNSSFNFGENTYGRERLHGAIWWGIGNVLIGSSIDRWGFECLSVLSIFSTLACYLMIYIYYHSQAQDHLNRRDDPENVPILHGDEAHAQYDYSGINSLTSQNHAVDTDENTSESMDNLTQKSQAKSYKTGDDDTSDTGLSFWSLLHILVKTPKSVGFFVAYFLLNVGFSVVENLIFLFYQAVLGSSYTMCGVSVIFTVALEIPIFYVSPTILEYLGPGWMQVLACAAFIFRTIGYVIVPHMGPVVFALDLFHGITYACSQAASVAFVAQIMPDSYEASGQGLLLLVRGLGGTLGLVLGGIAQEMVGARVLYFFLGLLVSFGMTCLICVLLLLQNE